ncbi:MAG TPA: dephospho-CoA kinase [Acidimicrobiales bacterium]
MSQGTYYRGEVKCIALAGGIGAGKSTVVDYLRAQGFEAIDADEVYRDLVAPGQPLLATLVDAFGTAILTRDGELDRTFLSAIVFHDGSALTRLNAITHPPVGRELRRQLDAAAGEAAFVAIPLFRPDHRRDLDLDEVWSIQVSPEIAVERLVAQRAMTEEGALARIAHQINNDEREKMADEVIWNNTERDALRARIDELLRERGLDGH